MNIHDLLEQRADAAPNDAYIIDTASQHSFEDIRAGAAVRADEYHAHGVREGDTVALIGSRSAPVVETLFALLKLGAKRHRFEAKVFGGGNVLRGLTYSNVGSRNAEFAEDYLRTERIPIIAHDIMGELPRKIYFFSQEGRVLVRKLRQLHNHTILDREAEYSSRLKQASVAGDVDLFT